MFSVAALAGIGIVASGFREGGVFKGNVVENASAEDKNNEFSTPVTYNPSECKRDAEGMVYFAAWRHVFRVPYEEPLSIRGMGAEERAKLPKRPDPSEPEGCPDNPIWGGSFSLPFRYEDASKSAGDTEFSMKTKRLMIVASYPENFGLQPLNESSFERIKRLYSTCDEVVEGLVGCRMPSEDKKFMGNMELSAYQTDPEVYGTPFGGKLTVACNEPYASEFHGRDCDVDYKYYQDLNVSYEFYRRDLPIKRLLDYDRALRDYIEKIQVKDYPWAD